MEEETANALRREFGYVPNEREGERWTVYQDRVLIVVHSERKPRLYERGHGGSYVEIEPILW